MIYVIEHEWEKEIEHVINSQLKLLSDSLSQMFNKQIVCQYNLRQSW